MVTYCAEMLKMGVILIFKFNLTLKITVNHKTIENLPKIFYISGPNLVILALKVDELSRGQAHDWRTHTHTGKWQYPKAKTGLG